MRFTRFLHDLSFNLAPGLCLLCHNRTNRRFDLCLACEHDLPLLTDYCAYCAEPLLSGSGVCARCLMDPAPFSATFCAFRYEHPADLLLQKFKDSGQRAAGYVLTRIAAKVFSRQLKAAVSENALITSVPLHPSKLRKRGFNQAALIADWLSADLGLETHHAMLERVHKGNSQRSLGVRGRRRNLSNAFQLKAKQVPRQATIVLVDDVVTTTSTVREISQVLLDSGVADVIVVALARTPLDQTA